MSRFRTAALFAVGLGILVATVVFVHDRRVASQADAIAVFLDEMLTDERRDRHAPTLMSRLLETGPGRAHLARLAKTHDRLAYAPDRRAVYWVYDDGRRSGIHSIVDGPRGALVGHSRFTHQLHLERVRAHGALLLLDMRTSDAVDDALWIEHVSLLRGRRYEAVVNLDACERGYVRSVPLRDYTLVAGR